jgi:CRP/FNR family transcriptional regulator, nitrogen oxide reductase regulator
MAGSHIATVVRELKPRLLVGFSPDDVDVVLSAAAIQRLQANSVVTHQGDPATHLFLLVSGRARHFFVTPDGQKTLLLWLPPGEIFGGATFLFSPQDYIVSTETVKASTALVWDRRTIRDLAQRYPRMLENALLIMFDYLVAYRGIHTSLVCNNARERLAQVLGNLATGIGHKVPAGVELDVRNEELANEANVTLFTASRLLSEWQRQGLVVKSRGKIVVRSPERFISSAV